MAIPGGKSPSIFWQKSHTTGIATANSNVMWSSSQRLTALRINLVGIRSRRQFTTPAPEINRDDRACSLLRVAPATIRARACHAPDLALLPGTSSFRLSAPTHRTRGGLTPDCAFVQFFSWQKCRLTGYRDSVTRSDCRIQ